jgi:hypothetical protein
MSRLGAAEISTLKVKSIYSPSRARLIFRIKGLNLAPYHLDLRGQIQGLPSTKILKD